MKRRSLLGTVKYLARKTLPATLLERIKGLLAPKCQRGARVYIAPGVQMIGAAHVRIGDGSAISEGCWFNVNSRESESVEIDIGANCFIGRRNFFSSGGPISIGSYCLTTIDCKFVCSSHVITDPMAPYMTTGTTSHDAISLGVNCFLGTGVLVQGNVRIGHGSVIGSAAHVMINVPPFSVVVGSPARVIKRYSFVEKAWIDAALVGSEAQLQYPDEAAYLAALQQTCPEVSMPLVAASSHFGNL